jgi:hypothetical protein
VVLAGVGDDVEGRHDQTRAVADDADLAVELDVVQAGCLRLRLERVGRILVLELLVLGVAHLGGVVVERHLAVEGDDVARGIQDEGLTSTRVAPRRCRRCRA